MAGEGRHPPTMAVVLEVDRIAAAVVGLITAVAEEGDRPTDRPAVDIPDTGNRTFVAKRANATRNLRAAFLVGGQSGASTTYPASPSFFFTRTTVTFENPSSNVGGLSLAAMRRMTSSSTERSRRRLRSRQTSTGTSKKTACTS